MELLKEIRLIPACQPTYTTVEHLSDCFTSKTPVPSTDKSRENIRYGKDRQDETAFMLKTGRIGRNRYPCGGLCIKFVSRSGTSYRAGKIVNSAESLDKMDVVRTRENICRKSEVCLDESGGAFVMRLKYNERSKDLKK